jgi:hypothetical protein
MAAGAATTGFVKICVNVQDVLDGMSVDFADMSKNEAIIRSGYAADQGGYPGDATSRSSHVRAVRAAQQRRFRFVRLLTNIDTHAPTLRRQFPLQVGGVDLRLEISPALGAAATKKPIAGVSATANCCCFSESFMKCSGSIVQQCRMTDRRKMLR